MKVRLAIVTRGLNHLATTPGSNPIGFPSLALLSGFSAAGMKSSKWSGAKVLPVWWSSVSRQAVSIFRIIHPTPLPCALKRSALMSLTYSWAGE